MLILYIVLIVIVLFTISLFAENLKKFFHHLFDKFS
jgi:hypothetical protein